MWCSPLPVHVKKREWKEGQTDSHVVAQCTCTSGDYTISVPRTCTYSFHPPTEMPNCNEIMLLRGRHSQGNRASLIPTPITVYTHTHTHTHTHTQPHLRTRQGSDEVSLQHGHQDGVDMLVLVKRHPCHQLFHELSLPGLGPTLEVAHAQVALVIKVFPR